MAQANQATRPQGGARANQANNNAAPTTNQVNDRTQPVEFLTVSQFKDQVGTSGLSILKNPNTGKLWMVTDGGGNYKVQQDIDSSLEMRVLVPDGELDQACLVNVEGGAEAIFSL